jgi:hypothetical protein
VHTRTRLTPRLLRIALLATDETIVGLARRTGLSRSTIHGFLRGQTVARRSVAEMARAVNLVEGTQ